MFNFGFNLYYQIEDPLDGFFMTMFITANIVFIDLAFDDGDCQYCYNGIVSKEYLSLNPYFNQQIKTVHSNFRKEAYKIDLDNMIQEFRDFQSSSVKIFQNNKEKEIETTSSISTTNYGIAHECRDFSDVNLAEILPSYFWEPYSEIDFGIHRSKPSEAQVKSDLQYYNKDYVNYPFDGYIRNIKAYAMYAESYPDANTDWLIKYKYYWWGKEIYYWLTPSEVTSLWYSQQGTYDTVVYPTDMIIHATVCFGFSGSNDIPHMAQAFVWYGATAYIGAANVPIPRLHNDDFTHNFWYCLCQLDTTVLSATNYYIERHNLYNDYPPGYNINWVYNNHIKIYGNTDAKLDN